MITHKTVIPTTLTWLLVSACGPEPEPRSLGFALPCDADFVAATLFQEPVPVPAEAVATTCLIGKGPRSCHVNGNTEVCCSPSGKCCFNNPTPTKEDPGGTYWCDKGSKTIRIPENSPPQPLPSEPEPRK